MKKPCNNCNNSFKYKNKYYNRIGNKICMDCKEYKRYEKYLEGKRKYKIGEKINTLDELLNQEFIFWRGLNKPLHITVIRNWQFNIVMRGIEEGSFYKAVIKEID